MRLPGIEERATEIRDLCRPLRPQCKGNGLPIGSSVGALTGLGSLASCLRRPLERRVVLLVLMLEPVFAETGHRGERFTAS